MTEAKLESLSTEVKRLYTSQQSKISKLDYDLKELINHQYFGLEFDAKEIEIKRLKAQLKQIYDVERKHGGPFDPSLNLFAPYYSYSSKPNYSKVFKHPIIFKPPSSKPSFSRNKSGVSKSSFKIEEFPLQNLKDLDEKFPSQNMASTTTSHHSYS